MPGNLVSSMQWDFLSQSRAALKWVRWIMKSVLLWRFIVKAGALLTLSMIYKVHRDWAWTSSAQDSLFICVNWAQLSLPCVALGKKHRVCDDQQRQSQRCHVRWWEKGERRGDVLTTWGQILSGPGSFCATSNHALTGEGELFPSLAFLF